MKAAVLTQVKGKLQIETREQPKAGAGEVVVRLQAAALNHRDVYIQQGLYPGIRVPVILGSDGCGTVVDLGEGVDEKWKNQSVIINPNNQWGDSEAAQSFDYHILGMPTNGTFAEYLCVKADRLHLKPAHLSAQEAAALPLAGMTAYRALMKRAALQEGEQVLISGIGGGVALFACQFALAAGAKVYVTSSSEEKIAAAVGMGASGGANYKAENWAESLQDEAGVFDVIIDSAGGPGFKHFLQLANMGGRIAFYGGTQGKFTLSPQKMFWKQVSLLGSTMGSDEDFKEMVDFVAAHKIKPSVDRVFPLEEAQAAFDYLDAGAQMGKVVLQLD